MQIVDIISFLGGLCLGYFLHEKINNYLSYGRWKVLFQLNNGFCFFLIVEKDSGKIKSIRINPGDIPDEWIDHQYPNRIRTFIDVNP